MKPERKISTEDALNILKNGKYGVLSTVSQAGVPYGVPLNYFYLPENNALYFHCALKGRKLENIAANSKVSFAVIGSEKIVESRFTTNYESVIVTGTASIVTDQTEKRSLLVQLCRQLAPTALGRMDEVIDRHMPAAKLVKIDVEEVSGKRNQDQ